MARPLSSPRPRTRVWLCHSLAQGSRRTAARFPALALLRPLPLLASPHRSGPRGRVPSFPSGSLRSVSWGGGARSVPPVGGKGSVPRRRPAALSPWLPGARAGRSRRRARGRDRARRRGGGPPSRVFHPRPPVRVPSYRVPARRFKDPRGGRLSVPGVGGSGGPVGSRRRPAAPADSRSSRGGWPFPRRAAAVGVREPPLGRPWGSPPRCPVRRCVAVRGPRVCRSRPAFLVFTFSRLSLAGPRRTPLRSPAASLHGCGGWRGDCAAVSSLPKGKRSYDS